MSEFKVNTITNRDGSYGPQVCGITTFRSSGMQLPSGPTEMRGGRGRGVFGSGATPSATTVMDLITIATKGNATDFGDDTHARQEGYAAFSSATRGLFAGGQTPTVLTNIAYVNISSQGGVNDFGDLKTPVVRNVGASDSVRGISAGGIIAPLSSPAQVTAIEFVTMSTTGNGNDFGNLTQQRAGSGACASPTRGLFAGGYSTAPNYNIIDFINFQKRIFPIGRLDKLSEGLILLTNDGEIVNKILRSRYMHEKEYLVTVNKKISLDFPIEIFSNF